MGSFLALGNDGLLLDSKSIENYCLVRSSSKALKVLTILPRSEYFVYYPKCNLHY